MTINRAFFPLAFGTVFLAACGGPAPRGGESTPQRPVARATPVTLPAPRPAPVVQPAAPPAAAIVQPPVASNGSDWRDGPVADGAWIWSTRSGGSIARFGLAGRAPMAMLVCDRAAGTVELALTGGIPGNGADHPASIATSTSSAMLVAHTHTLDGIMVTGIALPANNRLLDAMAFSRGRIAIEITGMGRTIVPAWSEVGRVVEDCRP